MMMRKLLEVLDNSSTLYYEAKESIKEACMLGLDAFLTFGNLKVEIEKGKIVGASYSYDLSFDGSRWVNIED